MSCSFCGSDEEIDENTPICRDCFDTFKRDQIPAINLRTYFLDGLEKKLKEVDSILFDLPESYFLWYLKGHLEHELGESKKSMRSINTSISYKDDFGDSWIRLGLIHSDMHREEDAKENFQKGLKYDLIDPSNLVDAGASLQASDQPHLSAKVLRRALDLVPNDDRAMVTLAKVLVQIGDLEGAKSLMDNALDLYPHNEEVLRSMAQIMMRMGDLDSAMDMYCRILDQHPRDFEALLAKGEIHLKLGELTQSLKSYQAVRDLDIHISWPGILRFLISSLRNMLTFNKNIPSYRDDLKKEFENINLFLEELDGKVDTAKGPEMLDEIESLIKVMENLRIHLKEQLGQFGDIIDKYRTEDSFQKHLRSKVLDLHNYLDQMRYFDGKQISLELSPFLTDLKSLDTRAEARLRDDLEKRFKELEEIGLEDLELRKKFETISDLEKRGDISGTTFVLKEIQMALDEVWNQKGKAYFNSKLKEMEDLLEKGKEQFETSRLEKRLRSFKERFDLGPKAILEGYLDFAKTYSEDSDNYYTREVENLIKEIDYKITILEKDQKDVKVPKRSLTKIENRLKKGEKALEIHPELLEIRREVSDLETKQKVTLIGERLIGLDNLLGDVDSLGMDEEIQKNVEPVRRVIEKSLKNENFRLADILTSEVYENVEKLIRENYIDDLKERMYDSLSEIERFRKLSITNEEWDGLLDETKGFLEEEDPPGPMIPIVKSLSRLQSSIQEFFIEELPHEIDSRLEVLSNILKEGEGYGFDLKWDHKVLTELRKRSEEISSLEIIEEAVTLEDELERKVSDLLSTKVREMDETVRKEIELLSEEGATQKELMEVLSHANRAEVLLESNSERDAYFSMNSAFEQIDRLRSSLLDRSVEKLLAKTDELIKASKKVGLDSNQLEKEWKTLSKMKDVERTEMIDRVKDLRNRTFELFSGKVLTIFEEFDGAINELIQNAVDILGKKDTQSLNDNISDLGTAIREANISKIVDQIKITGDLIERVRSSSGIKILLAKCSDIIETGSSLDDERAKDIVKSAKDLVKKIKKGKKDVSDKEIERLEMELSQLRSLLQIQDIENMLSEIEELDNLSKEIFEEIEGDEFEPKVRSINSLIGRLLNNTSSLYNSPEPDRVNEMGRSLNQARREIEDLENSWRAKKRLQSLEERGVFDLEIEDRLLEMDLSSLKDLYEKGDHAKFFRVWERVESQMKRRTSLSEKGGIPEDDKGMEILVRAKGKKRAELGKDQGKKGGMLGIKKLAMDMGEKRKLLERPPVGPDKKGSKGDVRSSDDHIVVTEVPRKGLELAKGKTDEMGMGDAEVEEKGKDKEEDNGKTVVPKPGKEDLAGIAKIIAGDRIKKLEEGGYSSMKDDANEQKKKEEGSLPWSKDRTMDVKGLNGMVSEMMDMEVQPQTSTPMKNAEKAREKLESFYSKLPANLRLEESMSLYTRGLSHLENGDHVGALRQFRLAISSAVKMTKLHSEITKAILSLDKELSIRRKRGDPNAKGEKLFFKAEAALKSGNLAECAILIKQMKNEMFP